MLCLLLNKCGKLQTSCISVCTCGWCVLSAGTSACQAHRATRELCICTSNISRGKSRRYVDCVRDHYDTTLAAVQADHRGKAESYSDEHSTMATAYTLY